MPNRDSIFDCLKEKLEAVGFIFEKKQKSHMQNRGWEFKFIHPALLEKLKENYKVRGKKFYIKQLSNKDKNKIGLVNGKSTPLNDAFKYSSSNSRDTFDEAPAWVNEKNNQALDKLLISIEKYLKV